MADVFKRIRTIVLLCVVFDTSALAVEGFPFPKNASPCITTLNVDWSLLKMYHHNTLDSGKAGYSFPNQGYMDRKTIQSERLYLGLERYRTAVSILPFIESDAKRVESQSLQLSAFAGTGIAGWIDSLDYAFRVQYLAEYYEEDALHTLQCVDGVFWRSVNHEDEVNSAVTYDFMASFHHDWFQAEIGRNSAHWGPGFFNNLTLNQYSNPYSLIAIRLALGPLRVYSLYGNLRVAPWGEANADFSNRSLFAHRYELLLGDLSLGISETQVLYDNMKPWLFVPTVPLFMEKGNYSEKSNNGAIAFDANLRLLKMLRLYSEFYLDDMESPISLVKNDNAEAKWAWMAGSQFGYTGLLDRNVYELGLILEYARVEPYVYTHFYENTAQTAHAGLPLGNPGGPNSMTVDFAGYLFWNNKISFLMDNRFTWKGTDKGSSLDDRSPLLNGMRVKKQFLKESIFSYSLLLAIKYRLDRVAFELGGRLCSDEEIFSNIWILL